MYHLNSWLKSYPFVLFLDQNTAFAFLFRLVSFQKNIIQIADQIVLSES